jgi:hypothetical protein
MKKYWKEILLTVLFIAWVVLILLAIRGVDQIG